MFILWFGFKITIGHIKSTLVTLVNDNWIIVTENTISVEFQLKIILEGICVSRPLALSLAPGLSPGSRCQVVFDGPGLQFVITDPEPQFLFAILRLKVQLCKLYNNKYIIASTQITNTEIFALIAVLVLTY